MLMGMVGGAVIGFVVGRFAGYVELMPYVSDTKEELQGLEARFGSARNSQWHEEWIVRDFFNDRRGGVFVDVGASHYKRFSNTYYLETELGWSGVAIEPQVRFAEEYSRYRPRTTFVPFFVSDTSNDQAILHVPPTDLFVASQSREFAESYGGDSVALSTETTTLDDVLARSGIEHLDFLNMDIELAEPAALRGFSIERYRPALVSIEAHQPVRQQILDYFARNGYVVLGRYLRADNHNLWFAPLE
jgi:FkbM family methyltransferase